MVNFYIQPEAELTPQDRLVLDLLQKDSEQDEKATNTSHTTAPEASKASAVKRTRFDSVSPEDAQDRDQQAITYLKNLNNPKSDTFEPTIITSIDTGDLKKSFLSEWLLNSYVRWARSVVRVDTDVVMLTHLLLYFSTSIPSAICLFYNFRWWHGLLHFVMQIYYMGPYTLLMHQHIHMRGVLNKKFAAIDLYFPYVTDPLFGHTWNSYFFHHVKHHHVEGNGPDDLSSTVRYQRDGVWDFLSYVGRFYFLIWFDLPRYFLQKNKPGLALKAGGCEIANYLFLYLMFTYVNSRATVFVFLMPLAVMRLALMVGNWGQHAFVDESEPTSDFRSSITVIDVASNRHCYNDGYHTSHHLNPLRHWRDHPISFIAQKKQYADEHALVFYNIDYLMITFCLLAKNYTHLARCLVPMGDQVKLTLEERAEMLRRKTRKFSEEEIAQKWGAQYARVK